MGHIAGTSDRIEYQSQASGEYYVYLDNKFYCSSDNYSEMKEDVMELDAKIDKGEI